MSYRAFKPLPNRETRSENVRISIAPIFLLDHQAFLSSSIIFDGVIGCTLIQKKATATTTITITTKPHVSKFYTSRNKVPASSSIAH